MEEELPETAPSSEVDIPPVQFYLTSVYDHSIYEAFSRVIQRLMPCQGAIEQLMDLVVQNCSFQKAFLFHLPTKLYVGSDSSPVDSKTHEICSDFVDLCVDFGGLYAPSREGSPLANGDTTDEGRHPATSKVTMASGLTLAHWEMDEQVSHAHLT